MTRSLIVKCVVVRWETVEWQVVPWGDSRKDRCQTQVNASGHNFEEEGVWKLVGSRGSKDSDVSLFSVTILYSESKIIKLVHITRDFCGLFAHSVNFHAVRSGPKRKASWESWRDRKHEWSAKCGSLYIGCWRCASSSLTKRAKAGRSGR